MIPGKINYRVSQILRTGPDSINVEGAKLATHDQVLSLIKVWRGGVNHSSKNIAMATNYPWVFKGKREIIQPVDTYKILIIPSLVMFDRSSLPKFRRYILQDKYAHYTELRSLTNDTHLDTAASMRLVSMNQSEEIEKEMERMYAKYNVTEEMVQQRVDNNINFIRTLCSIPMKPTDNLLSLLQGRKSLIRNIIPKKVPAIRSQILLRPELSPDQIILPYVWAKILNMIVYKLVPLEEIEAVDDSYFQEMDNVCLVLKRDPVINWASLSLHDKIAFADTEFIMVGMGDLENKNADFDGDTEVGFIVNDPIAILELKLNMSARYSMMIYKNSRVNFTEPHVLYMHQRNIANIPHKNIYNIIKHRETYKWLSGAQNSQYLKVFDKTYPSANIYKYVEPTRAILQNTLNAIGAIYSSIDAYNFYNFITKNVLMMANHQPSPLDDPTLPSDYLMGGDILCEPLIRVCMSEAKGTIESLGMLADRIHRNDNTTKLTDYVAPIDYKKLFSQIGGVGQTMANKSKEVSVNGHNFFKSNIGYETIAFDQQRLYYNGILIFDNLNFADIYCISPEVAFIITMGLHMCETTHRPCEIQRNCLL